jgi:hypothetical protein
MTYNNDKFDALIGAGLWALRLLEAQYDRH